MSGDRLPDNDQFFFKHCIAQEKEIAEILKTHGYFKTKNVLSW